MAVVACYRVESPARAAPFVGGNTDTTDEDEAGEELLEVWCLFLVEDVLYAGMCSLSCDLANARLGLVWPSNF